jgi:hypothetical protein
MSLALTYHCKDFGIVCSDGKVSEPLPGGHYATRKEIARKFRVLRTRPGLVLAGTSSIAAWLDFAVYDAAARHVEDFSEASFDDVSRIIAPTVLEARAAFHIVRSLTAPSVIPKFFRSTDGNFLNLLGYDRKQGRVRNRTFACMDRCCECEQDSGVTISGFLEPDEAWAQAGKLLELIGSERTPKVIQGTMLSLAAEISALLPETIGPPYSCHIVERPSL